MVQLSAVGNKAMILVILQASTVESEAPVKTWLG